MRIKAVIVDVGGVLIYTHSREFRERWAERLNIEPLDLENLVFNSESGYLSQSGQKSSDEHWQWIGHYFDLNPTDLKIMRNDFFSGDKINETLLSYCCHLQKAGYSLGIISNFFDDARLLWTTRFPILQHFKYVVISSEVGCMKPEPQIYHNILHAIEVKPEEAVFIDDFKENIEGALKVGMRAIHFNTNKDTIKLIQTLL